jgi:hypothetical protein
VEIAPESMSIPLPIQRILMQMILSCKTTASLRSLGRLDARADIVSPASKCLDDLGRDCGGERYSKYDEGFVQAVGEEKLCPDAYHHLSV